MVQSTVLQLAEKSGYNFPDWGWFLTGKKELILFG
jgi:hypothetical protein